MRNTGRLLSVMSMVFILVLVLAAPASAQEEETGIKTKAKIKKQINIFTSFGVATSQMDDALLDFGVEFELTQGLYARFIANSHLDTGGRGYYDYYSPVGYDYMPYYGGGFGLNNGTTLHGLSAYGVYKASLLKNTKFFLQAGLRYMSYWRRDYETNYGLWKRSERKGYGAGFGTGLEYYLSEKLGLILGGTYNMLLEDQPQWHPDEPPPGKPSWVHIYLGFSFRLKG